MSMSKADYQKIADTMKPRLQAFIDGKYCNAGSGQTFACHNPATGELIGHVAHCDADDVDRAVTVARKRFEQGAWSRTSPEARKEVLLKLADLVRKHTVELAVMESMDTGKTITDCLHEIGTEAPAFFQWYAELADKAFGKIAPTGQDALGLIVKEPVGVAGLIVPWNFPFLMAVWKVAPSLAVGCSAIVKPAEQAPLTALRLAELAQEAGVPDGVLQVLPGMGETAGQAIGRHGDVDVVSFTGSTEVGRLFMRYSGESNLKGISLEMGGKSPFIVLDDATINDDMIEHAAMSAFWNGGQNCSANMRQLIAAPMVEEYTDRVCSRVKAFSVGDPLDPATDIGSMITPDHKESVMQYIESGSSQGARMLMGGDMDRPGSFIRPTVFSDVTTDMTIAQDEIFGPVLGILPVKSTEQAVQIARDTEYGLHATLFTSDIDRAIQTARALPCGTVSINGFSEGDIKTPFGGYKLSGSLSRDNGTEALDQYLQTKTIWINVRNPTA